MNAARTGANLLRDALRAEGGTIGELLDVTEPDGIEPDGTGSSRVGPAQLAARGPRAAGHETEYELLIEMVVEGSRLHYGRPRVVRTDDPDLALLVGDQLYALGLARLAALADLAAIDELADVISLLAQANAASDSVLADAVWQAGAVAVGWGSTSELEEAKRLARTGDPAATAALTAAAARPLP